MYYTYVVRLTGRAEPNTHRIFVKADTPEQALERGRVALTVDVKRGQGYEEELFEATNAEISFIELMCAEAKASGVPSEGAF